jgi:F0F1-type ATP synthase assembly protein I
MKKIIITNGLIAGLIVTSLMLLSIAGCYKISNFEGTTSMVLGYTSMLLAFSLIFVGIKSYRDKHNAGIISFGKALKIGLLITLVASTIYVVVWMIDNYFFSPDFYERYSAHLVAKMKSDGAAAAEIQKQIIENQKMGEMYKNPFFKALFTYMEILPVGIIVSLIAALILKRRPNADNITAAGQVSL